MTAKGNRNSFIKPSTSRASTLADTPMAVIQRQKQSMGGTSDLPLPGINKILCFETILGENQIAPQVSSEQQRAYLTNTDRNIETKYFILLLLILSLLFFLLLYIVFHLHVSYGILDIPTTFPSMHDYHAEG